MKMKFLLCVVLIATMFNVVLSSYEKYFVPDESEYREEGEHIDILIRKRNIRVEKVKLECSGVFLNSVFRCNFLLMYFSIIFTYIY